MPTAAVSVEMAATAAVSAEMAATVAVSSSDVTSSGPTQPIGVIRRGSASIPAEVEGSRYRLGELLGQGGMGEVVLAIDERIGREVAVKRIRSTDPTAEELARFVREALVQGRLEHPAVVPVHDLAVDREGRPFFVMKRLTGTVMSDLLHQMGEAGTDQTALRQRMLRAFVDVCLAIELAHSKGIVHRDLKPSNIMLGDFGEVYVLDWGIARAVIDEDEAAPFRPSKQGLELSTGETVAGTVLGTPAFMAPEQLAGERAGPAADVYALGCILYEIVAGVALHQHKRSAATAATPVDGRPSKVRPDSPPELDAICEAATQIEPAARPASARALGDAVQAYLDGDRDIAFRRQLAAGHIAEARAALAGGDDEDARRTAMRSAGRALALDPTAQEAADLVTSLVLHPPKQIPAEVEERVARIDTETARSQGKLAAMSMVGYLGFVPLLLWTGIRDATFVIAFAALTMASGVQVLALTRRERISSRPIYVNACINAVLIGLVCRMVGPFIIAPTLVATTLMAYAAHPRFGRIGIIAIILASSVMVPWGLELAGLIAPTYQFVDGAIILHSPVVTFRSVPVQVAFALLLVALLAVVAVLSRQMAKRQREASSKVELQAWHLRQLVPSRDGR
ncbi:MAG: Serine/threonine protein kinase PrkC, regulator of stationary phase [Myxococcales bacterium]|nr:Serine/threonine protein kinase PrkC, regulator of stationary phase [Myxococcales bacterium]